MLIEGQPTMRLYTDRSHVQDSDRMAKEYKYRGKGPRALGALLPKIAAPAVRRRGFTAVEIVTRWDEIVGSALAADCSPERISFPQGARMDGTLHILASGSMALELQHLEPVLVERLNNFCGYRAVARIAIKQASHRVRKKSTSRMPLPPLDAARAAKIESRTGKIADENLRNALTRLGGALENRKSAAK